MAAKILVVDDDPNVQRLLQYTLKQEGYDVVIAADGAEGFRLWGAEEPDLILLDVMLPKLDGYQVAAKIRSEEGGASHVPIIMLTAEREVEQKVRGLRAGADDYLIKPFHPAELLARIKSLLARFAPRDALLARPPMGRVLAFYGAKGGVGTTTIAINTAIALHRELGRKVCLVDANLQFGDHRVFLDLGLDKKSVVDIVSAPNIDVDLVRQVMVKHDSGVDLLLAPPSPESADLVHSAHLPQIIEHLTTLYDYVLVDVDKRLDDVKSRDLRGGRGGLRGDDGGPLLPQERAPHPRDDGAPRVFRGQAPAGPEPIERVHGDQCQECRGCAQADHRPPGRERVPRGDQRPELGVPVHVHEGGLSARQLAPAFRSRRGQARSRSHRRPRVALTAPARTRARRGRTAHPVSRW